MKKSTAVAVMTELETSSPLLHSLSPYAFSMDQFFSDLLLSAISLSSLASSPCLKAPRCFSHLPLVRGVIVDRSSGPCFNGTMIAEMCVDRWMTLKQEKEIETSITLCFATLTKTTISRRGYEEF